MKRRMGMAKKSNMKVILGVGAVAAAAGIGYYFYNRSKSDALTGLGLLDVSRMGAIRKASTHAFKEYKWKFVTDGQVLHEENGMHNWHEVHPSITLPETPMPTMFYARGNVSGYLYAIADSYAYILMQKVRGGWLPVMPE
jgi:hypothetical protein